MVEAKTKEEGVEFEVLHTNASGNYDFVKDKISAKGVTDVVLIGGDGTVNQVVSALKDEDVNFGILPFGSGNGLAFSAGIPKSPAKALS